MSNLETRTQLLAGLPPAPSEEALLPRIQQQVAASGRKLVVIDDDPTGVQTVYDVRLLLDWDATALRAAFTDHAPLFFVLTNSRSQPEARAVAVHQQIAGLLREVADDSHFVVASRSDSTLRGHYPAEVDALSAALGPIDGHLIVPAFLDGGRVTINNTHYVATPNATADTLMPADQTPFAKDHAFGYSTAYLPAWVEERSGGRWRVADVATLDLELIRAGGPDAVAERLSHAEGGQPIVVNAASYGDLAVVVLGVLRAEAAGKRFIYRTAADFVRLRSGLPRRPLLTAAEILGGTHAVGGLVVVGSYVPGSSAQLEQLLALPGLAAVELPVARLLHGDAHAISHAVGAELEAKLRQGQTAVLYTSRTLITGATAAESLQIGQLVSQALMDALRQISTRPRFIIAKGGITSHDVAQRALGAQQARAIGQLLPGVPVWRLEQGPNLRFPDVPYIVFPGNVGGPESLAEAVRALSG